MKGSELRNEEQDELFYISMKKLGPTLVAVDDNRNSIAIVKCGHQIHYVPSSIKWFYKCSFSYLGERYFFSFYIPDEKIIRGERVCLSIFEAAHRKVRERVLHESKSCNPSVCNICMLKKENGE